MPKKHKPKSELRRKKKSIIPNGSWWRKKAMKAIPKAIRKALRIEVGRR